MTDTTPPPVNGSLAKEVARLNAWSDRVKAINEPLREPDDSDEPAPLVVFDGGETRRVRKLRAEVAESHLLAELQDDDTPLLLDSPRVRKHRRKAAEAARLHRLAQDPMMRAYRTLRARRRIVAVAMVALTLALGWSTAGVQAFAAEGAAVWSPRWWFAWLVEPFMSLALLVVVSARTYLATLDQPINSPTLTKVERLFLGLTLGMNAWPYLPWSLPEGKSFSVSSLVLHLLGPIVAVAIVIALPIILAAFTRLDLGLVSTPSVPLPYRSNAQDRYTLGTAPVQVLAAHVQNMIDEGRLSPNPGIHKIRTALGPGVVGVDKAREIQRLLASTTPTGDQS
ncbi:hypothetical protein [Nonomuraea sp. GTA35]|uniref:hypothetical protein n=1 Tax=Nonomuraea sp. GTA35 TaxID=1676746 RepID=UPI0035BF0325